MFPRNERQSNLECSPLFKPKYFFIGTMKYNANEMKYSVTESNMPILTRVAGAFAAGAVEAPLDDALVCKISCYAYQIKIEHQRLQAKSSFIQ